MDEIQAAFLNVKLKYIEEDIDGRRKVANFYLDNIKNDKIVLPKVLEQEGHVWHLFVVRVADRNKFQEYLSNHNIQTLIHYPIPPHKQEAYKEYNDLTFEITEKIHEEVVSLPINSVLTMKQLSHIVDTINKY